MTDFEGRSGHSGARPAEAATVILARDGVDDKPELLLLRRHRKQAFMAGAYVFPGGRMDPTDLDPRLQARIRGRSPEEAVRSLQEPDLPPEWAVGLFLAAIRETFEEAGVLLTTGRDPNDTDILKEYRRSLQARELTFPDLAEREDLHFDLTRLEPYAHWITPEIEKIRFDARFFLGRLPRGQEPIHDAIETTDSIWLSPTEALASHRDGNILLMPPTLITCEDLAGWSAWEEARKALAGRRMAPILPQPFIADQTIGLKLPHDPEYTITEYKQTSRAGDPSRLLLVDGRWRVVKD